MDAFLNDADELNHINVVLGMFPKGSQTTEERYQHLLDRFLKLLERAGQDNGSIMRQDHWARYYEAAGVPEKAIPHRQLQIARIHRLFDIGGPIGNINEEYLIRILTSLLEDNLLASERLTSAGVGDRQIPGHEWTDSPLHHPATAP